MLVKFSNQGQAAPTLDRLEEGGRLRTGRACRGVLLEKGASAGHGKEDALNEQSQPVAIRQDRTIPTVLAEGQDLLDRSKETFCDGEWG